MTGLGLLLKSFGVEIDPAEITAGIEQLKTRIPEFASGVARAIERMDARLAAIERDQAEILRLLRKGEESYGSYAITATVGNGSGSRKSD